MRKSVILYQWVVPNAAGSALHWEHPGLGPLARP